MDTLTNCGLEDGSEISGWDVLLFLLMKLVVMLTGGLVWFGLDEFGFDFYLSYVPGLGELLGKGAMLDLSGLL